MKRLTNIQKRVLELEDALLNLLEVQIIPSTPNVDEWTHALKHARRVYRNKVVKGWNSLPPIDMYELHEEYDLDMQPPEYVGAD